MKHFITLMMMIAVTATTSAQGRYEIDTLQWVADSDKAFDLVFLGDGYTQSEMDKFVQDIKEVVTELFEFEPWKTYRNYFNVVCIKTPSKDSGCDNETLDRDKVGTPEYTKDTFFDSGFWYYGTQRLVYPSWPSGQQKVTSLLSECYPKYDCAAMAINTDIYGGAGGSFLTFTREKSSKWLLFHEAGHTVGDLADEYWAGAIYASETKPNMTRENKRSAVKWKAWLDATNIFGKQTERIGVYRYTDNDTSTNWYRPHSNCLMRFLEREYCYVCREAMVESFHDAIEPVLSFAPANKSTMSVENTTVDFTIDLIHPDSTTLSITWTVDGDTIDCGDSTLKLFMGPYADGTHELIAAIEDTTYMLRIENHASRHTSVVKWQFNKSGGIVDKIDIKASSNKYIIDPIPFSTELTVRREYPSEQPFAATLTDVSGKLLASSKASDSETCQLQAASLPAGIYIITISEGGRPVLTRKIIKE